MENIKITLPQIPSLKIVLPGQGGTSITVDSEMSDTSENPVQNKVAKKYADDGLLPKIEIWQPNTKYKENSLVLAVINIDDGDYFGNVLLTCIKEHTSGDYNRPDVASDFYDCWSARPLAADSAYADAYGNIIHKTYAKKEELGDIETALDSIIAMQNELIGGESV